MEHVVEVKGENSDGSIRLVTEMTRHGHTPEIIGEKVGPKGLEVE